MSQGPAPDTRIAVIQITGDSVNRPTVTIPDDGDEVRWESNTDFTVEFQDSPFKDKKFDKARPNSGRPHKKGHYEYVVRSEMGSMDPTIIVK